MMQDFLGDIMSRDVGVVGWYGEQCDLSLSTNPPSFFRFNMIVIERQMIEG